MAIILGEIFESVIKGDGNAAKELVEKALAEGFDPQTILRNSLTLAMEEVGRRMETEEYFIPEVLLSARAVKAATQILKPIMMQTKSVASVGRVAIGTVEGDLHDIGKNLVAIMLEGVGFEVVDLGINVSVEKFLESVKETRADILAMSALLTTTMGKMKEVIQGLTSAGYRNDVLVMVGGAPVTEEYASEIGADGSGRDAGAAARLAKELCSKPIASHSRTE